MPDIFGLKQVGRATTGGRFYATPTERVEAGAIYVPNESSPLFGVAEYPVEAGTLGAFTTEGTFVFDKPGNWIDDLGRKVFFRPSTGEIVNQDQKGDVLIGFQVFANVPDYKLGVVLTQGENSVIVIVTSTADSGAGSLRQAILDAQNGDVILFDADVFPDGATTSILLSSTLVVPKNIEIDGDGRVALDGQNAIRVCAPTASDGAAAHLKGMTIKNGAYANGAGVILQYGQPILTDCIIENCNATSAGGGVYLTSSAVGTLNNCKIRNCTSGAHGGGVYFNNSSQSTLNDCVITNCTAGTNGGGLAIGSASTCILNRCSITDCAATSDHGGGVYAYTTGAFTLNGCTIGGNTSADTRRRGVTVLSAVSFSCADTSADVLFLSLSDAAAKVVSGSITVVEELYLTTTSGSIATVTFDGGAALAVTANASIPNGTTFTSETRGYLAVASGVDTSNATFNNVVLCSYGAGLESFEISANGATWTAQDLTTPILIETRNNTGEWDTLTTQASGGAYATAFDVGTTARAFDGVRFFVASIDGYWCVSPSVAVVNGGGSVGSDGALWFVSDSTITPNVKEI